MNTPLSDLIDLAARMESRARESGGKSFDVERLREMAKDFLKRLSQVTEPLPATAYMPALSGLCRGRAFSELAQATDQLVRLGYGTPAIRNLQANALIELQQVTVAIAILERVLPDTKRGDRDHLEARSLLGRTYKQIYIDEKREPRRQWGEAALHQSIRHYTEGYLSNSNPALSSWHVLNAAALMKRARRDGIPLPPHARPEALATRIVETLAQDAEKSTKDDDASVWRLGDIAWAYAILGEWQKAADWFKRYAGRADGFKLTGTMRQLEEVWDAMPGNDDAGRVLAALKAQVMQKCGRLDVSASDIEAFARLDLEAVPLGNEPMPVGWLKTGLQRARGVGRIACERGPFGTGFLVRGRDLLPSLGEEVFMLTNNHVVSTSPGAALLPEQAIVSFDEDDEAKRTFKFKEIVWQSPVRELDATLLRFEASPAGKFGWLPLAPDEALREVNGRENHQQAFVIGHPADKPLCISLQDSKLFDVGFKDPGSPQFEYLRYTTPTRGGNSGSPVFDELNWEVIGLHHAGWDPLHDPRQRPQPKLGGKDGMDEAANEGISIRSIRRQIRAERGGNA